MIPRIFTAAILVLAFILAPSVAQQTPKIPRIGFLAPPGRSLPLFDAFQQGLADSGYTDGKSIAIESRFHYERFPEIFAKFASLKVDIVAVTGAVTARAAKIAFTDVSIVFSVVVNPVADNVVAGMEHPGGNLTGVEYPKR